MGTTGYADRWRAAALGCVLTALLAALLAGCGGGADPEATTPADVPPTDSGPEASPDPGQPLPCVPAAAELTGTAVDELGADRVAAAYCLLAELALDQVDTSLALPVGEWRPRDLVRIRRLLTPVASADWDRLLRAARTGDDAAIERVAGLALHDVRQLPPGFATADDDPFVFGTQVGPATAETADGGGALRLDFTVSTGLVLEEQGDTSGRHSLLPVTRTGSYVLVPDGDGWLVDRWQARFEQGEVRLVSGG